MTEQDKKGANKVFIGTLIVTVVLFIILIFFRAK